MSLTYYLLSENERDYSRLFHNTAFDIIVLPHELREDIDVNHLGTKMLISIEDGEPEQINERAYKTNLPDVLLELKYLLRDNLHVLLIDDGRHSNVFINRADFVWIEPESRCGGSKVVSKLFTPLDAPSVRGKLKFRRSIHRRASSVNY